MSHHSIQKANPAGFPVTTLDYRESGFQQTCVIVERLNRETDGYKTRQSNACMLVKQV